MFASFDDPMLDCLASRDEPQDDPILPVLRSQVAARLGVVCAHFAPGEFTELVDRVARFKRRWQLLEAPLLDVEQQKRV